MDKLNFEWLKGEPNFYFKHKRKFLEAIIEGSCINVGCGSHIIENALNVDEGLPDLPYADNSFDTVICSDVLEHIGPHKQAIAQLMRIARKKLIITAPAYRWLHGRYDQWVGHKRRYHAYDFAGFEISYLFWFLVPVLWLRKIFHLKHHPLPKFLEDLFLNLSGWQLNFGTTIVAIKYKVPDEEKKKHKASIFIPVFNEELPHPGNGPVFENRIRKIRKVLRTVDYIMGKTNIPFKIFVANDASPEIMEIVNKKTGPFSPKVTWINFGTGPTVRENLAKAFKNSGGDIVAFADLDLVTSFRFFPDLINDIILGSDIVTGNRYMPGSKTNRNLFRWLLSVFYNELLQIIFRIPVHDQICGFKAFKKDVLLKLCEDMGYDRSLRRGLFWDSELFIRATRRGYAIKEIPLWWKEREKIPLHFKRKLQSIAYMAGFLRAKKL